MTPKKFSYESMGTHWEISIWDEIDSNKFREMKDAIIKKSGDFDNTYSRFKKNSLVWKIAEGEGTYEVPEDLTKMLTLYSDFYLPSQRKLNPLIGFMISDLGYDENYSLVPKEIIRLVPDFADALKILDVTHIQTRQKVLIDLGALGKGYFVDRLADFLKREGIKRFLVNGSGDIWYEGEEKIRAGLEHPTDKTKVIGAINLSNIALCASGIDRRKWDKYNHVIDPDLLTSPEKIISTWVVAGTAALADALATCLFLVPPENFSHKYKFEYCILDKDMKIKKSKGFAAEFY